MFPFTHGVIASSSAQSTDFIIRVKTDNAGTSASNQFTLPATILGLSVNVYDYDIDWGDGVVENITVNTPQTHTYPTAGIYTIKISGLFPRIYFNNGGDKLKLIETVNFGDVGWNRFNNAFQGCTNNVINPNCTGNFDLVTGVAQAWQNNTSNNFFPAIDMPLCSTFSFAWFNNNLSTFPNINVSSGTTFASAWENNLFVTFPDLLMPSATSIDSTWRGNLLESIPAIDMPNVVAARFAWADNDLSYVPNFDISSCLNMRFAFENNGVISNFELRNFNGMTDGTNCFRNTTLPTSDYSDILITQRANNPNNSVTFHGGSSKYNTAGGTARGELVSIQSWSITDGGAE